VGAGLYKGDWVMLKMKEIAEKLQRLTFPLACTKPYDWLMDRHQPGLFVLFLGCNISVDYTEVIDKTDKEIEELITDKIRSMLEQTLKEIGK